MTVENERGRRTTAKTPGPAESAARWGTRLTGVGRLKVYLGTPGYRGPLVRGTTLQQASHRHLFAPTPLDIKAVRPLLRKVPSATGAARAPCRLVAAFEDVRSSPND